MSCLSSLNDLIEDVIYCSTGFDRGRIVQVNFSGYLPDPLIIKVLKKRDRNHDIASADYASFSIHGTP